MLYVGCLANACYQNGNIDVGLQVPSGYKHMHKMHPSHCSLRLKEHGRAIAQLFAYKCRLLINFANSMDPDQARRNVGPDLGPNCLTH